MVMQTWYQLKAEELLLASTYDLRYEYVYLRNSWPLNFDYLFLGTPCIVSIPKKEWTIFLCPFLFVCLYIRLEPISRSSVPTPTSTPSAESPGSWRRVTSSSSGMPSAPDTPSFHTGTLSSTIPLRLGSLSWGRSTCQWQRILYYFFFKVNKWIVNYVMRNIRPRLKCRSVVISE